MTDVEPLAPKGGLWSAPWTNLVVRALEDEPSQGALFRCEVVDGIVERGTVVRCALDDDQWERVDASPKPAPLGVKPATDEQIAEWESRAEMWRRWNIPHAGDALALIARIRREQERRQNAEAACADASDHSATADMRLQAAEAERDRLRAEVDRMRPVVWAAEHYEEITDVADATLLMGASRRLARAVRAYREGEA